MNDLRSSSNLKVSLELLKEQRALVILPFMYAGVIFLNVFSVLYTGSKSEFYFYVRNELRKIETKFGSSLSNRFSSTVAYASYWTWCVHYCLDCL